MWSTSATSSELQRDFEIHAEIARALGPYKLSLHSGSDKYSTYPLIAEATQGVVHLKTAGTSWAEALRVIANNDPDLMREVLRARPRQLRSQPQELPPLLRSDENPHRSNR